MPPIFPRSANALAKASLILGLLLLVVLGWVVFSLMRSPYLTRQGEILQQPVPFSHDHHVAEVGIDCRYCHTAVEKSASAGIPPTATCMNCHNQIWAQAPLLEPVRASFRDNKSLEWSKLNDLPDFVYFNHSIHVAKGVACITCHGPVNRMPLMYQWATLQMEWCLACHRDPVKNLRPREEVANVFWQPPADLPELQQKLAALYNVKSKTSCSTCHR